MNDQITVVGTIATEPKLIQTRSGVGLCTFRLASGDRRFDRESQKWVDGETNWFGVTAFRALAENAHRSFQKGQRVIVSGRLRIRKWESGEKSGTSVDIEAEALGHDLRWGVSAFEKQEAPEPSGSDGAETDASASEARAGQGTAGAGIPGHSAEQADIGEMRSADGFTPAVA